MAVLPSFTTAMEAAGTPVSASVLRARSSIADFCASLSCGNAGVANRSRMKRRRISRRIISFLNSSPGLLLILAIDARLRARATRTLTNRVGQRHYLAGDD